MRQVALPNDTPTDVVFCCNGAFFQHLGVAVCSLLANNPQRHFRIHIICTDTIEAETMRLMSSTDCFTNAQIRLYPVERQLLEAFFVNGHVTAETYLRIFIPQILDRTIEKVIYLDCDIVVVGNIDYLCEIDVAPFAAAGVVDVNGERRKSKLRLPAGNPYVNAGVLVLNLKQLREEKITDKLIETIQLKGAQLHCWDQDAINIVLNGRIRAIDVRWNFPAKCLRRFLRFSPGLELEYYRHRRTAAIVHFIDREKPWRYCAVVAGRELYTHYRSETMWRTLPADRVHWHRGLIFPFKMILYACLINHHDLERIVREVFATAGRFFARRTGRFYEGGRNQIADTLQVGIDERAQTRL